MYTFWNDTRPPKAAMYIEFFWRLHNHHPGRPCISGFLNGSRILNDPIISNGTSRPCISGFPNSPSVSWNLFCEPLALAKLYEFYSLEETIFAILEFWIFRNSYISNDSSFFYWCRSFIYLLTFLESKIMDFYRLNNFDTSIFLSATSSLVFSW